MPTRRFKPALPFIAIGAAVALVAAAVRWVDAPDPGRRRGSHEGPCHNCGTRMRALAHGLTLWAEQHNGQLPPADEWVDSFIAESYAPREVFTSPSDPVRGRVSYIYVPAESIDPTGRRVLLYEPPDLHPECGVHIAFHDGHVELHQVDEAQRIIDSTLRESAS